MEYDGISIHILTSLDLKPLSIAGQQTACSVVFSLPHS